MIYFHSDEVAELETRNPSNSQNSIRSKPENGKHTNLNPIFATQLHHYVCISSYVLSFFEREKIIITCSCGNIFLIFEQLHLNYLSKS